MCKKAIFSVAYDADRQLNKFQYRYRTWSVIAFSIEEAMGKAFIRCKEEFPISDGWIAHDVSVLKIPNDILEEIWK